MNFYQRDVLLFFILHCWYYRKSSIFKFHQHDEQEAFSNFTKVSSFDISYSTIGAINSRFLILDDVAYVSIRCNNFGLWAKCAFCGVSATKVAIYNNVVNASQGSAFSGMSGVSSLSIVGNTLPSIIVRFFPFDLQTLSSTETKQRQSCASSRARVTHRPLHIESVRTR